MLADFLNSFAVVFSEKFATKTMPHYPPHLRYVAALPCETYNLKFNHLRLQLLQTVHKNQYFTI